MHKYIINKLFTLKEPWFKYLLFKRKMPMKTPTFKGIFLLNNKYLNHSSFRENTSLIMYFCTFEFQHSTTKNENLSLQFNPWFKGLLISWGATTIMDTYSRILKIRRTIRKCSHAVLEWMEIKLNWVNRNKVFKTIKVFPFPLSLFT